MIFVERSRREVPAELASPRATRAKLEIKAVLSESSQEHLEQLSFRFISSLWMSARPALTGLFNGKCAYCETGSSAGVLDIEHFRPKQGALDLDGRKIDHLHYAWLAYDWDNLHLACAACNRMRRTKDGISGKGSRFPVDGSRAGLLADVGDCRRLEQGTMLDPCFDNPAEHLVFEKSGQCKALTPRGALTIGLANLNRRELVAARKAAMAAVSRSFDPFRYLGGRESQPLSAFASTIAELVDNRAPYAGAARGCFERECRDAGAEPPPSDAYRSKPAVQVVLAALQTLPPFEMASAKRTRSYKVATYLPEDVPDVVFAPSQYGTRQALPVHGQRWLSRIEIKNFKALEHIVIEIPDTPSEAAERAPCLMLLGENASGKSSILEAVSLALLGQREIRRLRIKGQDYLRRDHAWKLVGKPAEIRLTLAGDKDPAITLTISTKGAIKAPTAPQTVVLGYGPRRFFSNTKGLRRKEGTAARLETLFDPTAIITNPSSWLMNSNESDYSAAVRALRQVLLLDEKSFVARPPRGQRAGKELMFELQGAAIPLKRLSEGYRTIVATAVDIMREMLVYWPNLELARGVVLIDELDTHLHPRWKMRILQRLREALPGVQFIATTHDPLCLRGLYDGEVQVLRRIEGSHVEQVVDLPNVQGLTVEQLLTSDFFGLLTTEDPSVEADLKRYVALATKDERTPDEEEELKQHRDKTQRRLRLGRTPQEQLVLEAASAFVVGQRQATDGAARAAMKEETAQRMLGIWSKLTGAKA
jgi:uncharacterized protein (TIGR02646 family)